MLLGVPECHDNILFPKKQNEVHICADKNMDSAVPSLWGRDHC